MLLKNVVLISCDNNYVPKSIITLNMFCKYNPNYEKVIIGTLFDDNSKKLCNIYNIKLIEINLYEYFDNLDNRKYGKQYPIECFYHLYAYKLLNDYDFIIQIEPDISTNKEINIDFSKIEYIGGSYNLTSKIKDFLPIMKDYERL